MQIRKSPYILASDKKLSKVMDVEFLNSKFWFSLKAGGYPQNKKVRNLSWLLVINNDAAPQAKLSSVDEPT